MSPLACIIITLFAIPAGIATGRQSVFKGIVGALAMFFAFYGLTIGFMILAKRGMCPPLLAATLPDVVFFGIGCHLFWRQR
jgi:lipopolysaccharide export LptBFGC system permease protein LptF